MAILHNDTAITKYGEIGKNGAVEIIAKKVKEIETWQADTSNDDNKVFVKMEIEPAFPGGEKEWRNFLTRNIDATIPVKNGCKPGTYTVIVQFIVSRNGRVSDVKALTNHGYGMEEEAMRIIKKGPDWLPGMQKGRKVNAYRKQPITFVIVGTDGKQKGPTTSLQLENGSETVRTGDSDNKIFVAAEAAPYFAGGEKEWRRYLERNLDPQVAKKNGCKSGTFKVLIRFMVDKKGKIKNVTPVTKNGYGLEEHVASLIAKSPVWSPAIQNGQKKSAYNTQVVTFIIGNGNPDSTKKVDTKSQPGMLNEIVVTGG